MTTLTIGRIVIGCLTAGPLVGLALVVGPLAGEQEHVITGAALVACASSWALLAVLSTLWTSLPQRWAAVPAGFLGLAGIGLVVFAPSSVGNDALGWVWPPLVVVLVAWTVVQVHRHVRSRTRLWLAYPLLGVYTLGAVGAGYQTVREWLEHRRHVPPGQLVDIGGRRLHLSCRGVGAPTVVLEASLGETAASFTWISSAVARDTTVCVYDRLGRGWSDPAPVPQDGLAVARDLHALLDHGGVRPPFVLVGYSSGAAYVRIFASQYPDVVAGMVLLDGQPSEAFDRLPDYPAFYSRFRRATALLPSLARVGVGRLVFHRGFESLPAGARDMQRLHYSSTRHWRSLRDEFAALPTSLAQARSLRSLGARPLIVVTAARNALDGWRPLQERMATLSTNSRHRIVPYTHDELVSDKDAAVASSDAIRDVVHAQS